MAQARGLALSADPLMKSQSLGNGQVLGAGWVPISSKLADVGRHRGRRGHQRPEIPNLVPFHVQHAGAMRTDSHLCRLVAK